MHSLGSERDTAAPEGGPRSDDVSIRVDNLHFTYGNAEVLHGLSFTVRRGEVTGLLGPNGAGKSTTLRVLIGILEASSGTVEVEGLSLPAQAFAVKQRVGYVPEAAELYDTLSAQEFLELCGRLHSLDEGRLQRRIEAFLDGLGLLDERLQRLNTYSKGMKQKVLLASALIHDPAVVVLDEPLSGLDADAAVLVKRLLSALAAQGKTVLYSSHVLEVVERVCARVLILDHGTLIADDSPAALMSSTHEHTLEDVFRRVTQADDVEPRLNRILGGLRQ
jgi:ABC-2 type transport system ATP-binding protein